MRKSGVELGKRDPRSDKHKNKKELHTILDTLRTTSSSHLVSSFLCLFLGLLFSFLFTVISGLLVFPFCSSLFVLLLFSLFMFPFFPCFPLFFLFCSSHHFKIIIKCFPFVSLVSVLVSCFILSSRRLPHLVRTTLFEIDFFSIKQSFSFLFRYVENAFTFRTFNIRRQPARNSLPPPSPPILTQKQTKCFRSLRCSAQRH